MPPFAPSICMGQCTKQAQQGNSQKSFTDFARISRERTRERSKESLETHTGLFKDYPAQREPDRNHRIGLLVPYNGKKERQRGQESSLKRTREPTEYTQNGQVRPTISHYSAMPADHAHLALLLIVWNDCTTEQRQEQKKSQRGRKNIEHGGEISYHAQCVQ